MSAPLLNQLRDLASLWCRLTGGSPEDFNKEFFRELDILNRFTGQFPHESPTGLSVGLEESVMKALTGRFTEAELREARDWLARRAADHPDTGESVGFAE